MIQIRIIGAPEEMDGALEAVEQVFDVRRTRRYPSRKKEGDVMVYLEAEPKAGPAAEVSDIEPDIKEMKIRLKDRDGMNHVYVMMDFVVPHYIEHKTAAKFNSDVQDAVRRVIFPDARVLLRLDQSRPRPMPIVYCSGNEWEVF